MQRKKKSKRGVDNFYSLEHNRESEVEKKKEEMDLKMNTINGDEIVAKKRWVTTSSQRRDIWSQKGGG